ncbi:hypothetical protein [Foetidibacter luteolus]|uniref:hypothetical protein n=1 Tax=Foetidibacter luteolus TaxID=2608880 RepID=UPI00129AA987|nr:hypothetical protein [Foetidibacter luteolus]
MKFYRFFVLTTLLFFASTSIFSQSVTGKWYGIGNIAIAGATNSYLCEFLITQKGNRVTGEFNYFFRNGYFSSKITGSFDNGSRMLKIKTIPILYHGNKDIAIGVDCLMEGEFILRISKVETILLGNFSAPGLHKFTCAPLNIKFNKLKKDEPTLKERIAAKPLELEEDPVVEKDTVQITEPVKPKPETVTEKEVIRRRVDVVKELEVTDDSVRLDLYDNAEYDHDSISLFYNNKLKIYKEELNTRKPISFYVQVDSIAENNKVVIFAENLGELPPNAALMIVTDSEHRYEVNINSDYLKNGAVLLRKKKKSRK